MIEFEFKQIERIITSKSFQKNKGLSNEVAYYVYDYDPSQELLARFNIDKLVNKYSPGKAHLSIIHLDLYDVMIDYLIQLKLIDQCVQMEKENGFDYLHESLAALLRMDYEDNYFIRYLKDKIANIEKPDVVFITGIGKVFPIIRAHHILNKLHLNFDESPVIFFYPGKYDGQSFNLFNAIRDENYYRAFPLRNLFETKEGDY